MNNAIPSRTIDEIESGYHTIIIGGGIAGCSTAYHLAKEVNGGVLIVEQGQLAGGTSWHAAGLVGRLRTSNSMTQVNNYSAQLYSQLKDLTGINVEWRAVGSLILATSPDRMIQLRRTTAMAEVFGIRCEIISAGDAQEKWPHISIDDVLEAAWLPDDGRVNPKSVVHALAQAAVNNNAHIHIRCEVQEILTTGSRISGVRIGGKIVKCENLVFAAGMWTRQLASGIGVNIPLYPVEHHYVVSEPVAGISNELPVARDPDYGIYFRAEDDCIMLGAFQKYTKPWEVNPIPSDFSFQLLGEDWEKFSDPLAAGKNRIPALGNIKFQKFVNGPESFTPDNNFLLGQTPEFENLYVSAGFNSAGIASAGGAGMLLSRWIIDKKQPMDLWSVDIRRFHPVENNSRFLKSRVTECLGLHYQMAWPNREFCSGRQLRKSALYEKQAEQGAVFGSKCGWERPLFYAPEATQPFEIVYSFGKQNWFEYHRSEHLLVRNHCGILDQSSLSKYLIESVQAQDYLSRLCAGRVDIRPGESAYTPVLNADAGIESDIILIRTGDYSYMILSSTAQRVKDYRWFRKIAQDSFQVSITDITNQYAVISLMGPYSGTFLNSILNGLMDEKLMFYGSYVKLEIGAYSVHALRRSYVGESGWELYTPVDQASQVYDFICEEGKMHQVFPVGTYAVNSLRLEKGFRAWGSDITTDEDPIMAGMTQFVDYKNRQNFLGFEQFNKLRQSKTRKRLIAFKCLDKDIILWGQEPIYSAGIHVGYTTSGAYGHSFNASVALGYVNMKYFEKPGDILTGDLKILVDGKLISTEVSLNGFSPVLNQ